VRELASRISHESRSTSPTVIVNCLTPGACTSDFFRETTGIKKFIDDKMSSLIARTTEAGSRTLVAALAAGEESHGSFMVNCEVSEYVTSHCS
jgi:retinol dehydrogenase-12